MKKIFLTLSLLSFSAVSGLYSEDEITDFLSQKSNSPLSTEVLTSNAPLKTLTFWLKSQQDELTKEQQLFELLNVLATMPPDPMLMPLLDHLKQYESQAVKIHAEARHPSQATEAIFHIASKAAGVENIWQMKSAQQRTQQILMYSHQPLTDLENLLKNHVNQRNATLLGIKNALLHVSEYDLNQLKQACYQSAKLSITLHDTVADLAIMMPDLAFAQWAISNTGKSQAERIYKQSSHSFSEAYVTALITQDIKSKANPSFVTSLLAQYPDNQLATHYLLKQLVNPRQSAAAAFALSRNEDPMVWQQMAQIHQQSQSAKVKSSIQLSLKQNPSPEAQHILKRLAHDKGEKS